MIIFGPFLLVIDNMDYDDVARIALTDTGNNLIILQLLLSNEMEKKIVFQWLQIQLLNIIERYTYFHRFHPGHIFLERGHWPHLMWQDVFQLKWPQ